MPWFASMNTWTSIPPDKGSKDGRFPPDKGGKGGYIPYNKTLTEKARKNRKNPTPAEQKLWHEVLQSKRLDNLKFTRQKPLDEYIVDFYCSELMLAIEIDGDTHAKQKQYDRNRTKNLNKHGVEVIRYTNADVLNNLEGVYQDLHKRVSARKPLNPPCQGDLMINPLGSSKKKVQSAKRNRVFSSKLGFCCTIS